MWCACVQSKTYDQPFSESKLDVELDAHPHSLVIDADSDERAVIAYDV